MLRISMRWILFLFSFSVIQGFSHHLKPSEVIRAQVTGNLLRWLTNVDLVSLWSFHEFSAEDFNWLSDLWLWEGKFQNFFHLKRLSWKLSSNFYVFLWIYCGEVIRGMIKRRAFKYFEALLKILSIIQGCEKQKQKIEIKAKSRIQSRRQ